MNELKQVKRSITVFGGSSPKPGEAAYENAYLLGRYLGRVGFIVLTGGYIGTMEAVSRGVMEGGGHTIGVTCDEIERWRPVGPNSFVQEERRYERLQDRLIGLIEACDAAIALPGGIGTLTEIMLMWTLISIQAIPQKPLYLVGTGWRETLHTFQSHQQNYIPENQIELITCLDDVNDLIHELGSLYREYGVG